jgi:hypothetical protein
MVRFFSRYNEGLIVDWLDYETLSAVDKYKNLRSFKGMSPERIQTEFLLGIKQSKNVSSFLQNYQDLGLFPSVLSNCEVDLSAIPSLKDAFYEQVVLTMLLQYNNKVAEKLNTLKYTSMMSDTVQFLVDALHFDPRKHEIGKLLKARDKRLIKLDDLTPEMRCVNGDILCDTHSYLRNICCLIDNKMRREILEHLTHFYPVPTPGEKLMEEGLVGPQIGLRQRQEVQDAYKESLKKWMSDRNLPDPFLTETDINS